MRKPEIGALTGVRGVAAMMVVLYHFLPGGRTGWAWLDPLIGRGYLWVDLFFVLSGSVIALNYAGPFRERLHPRDFGDFLWRRLARLYPVYGAILGAQVIYTLLAWGHFHAPATAWAVVSLDRPFPELLANLLLAQSWGLAPSVIAAAWSVSTEWAAYLLFPLLVAWGLAGSPRRAAGMALAAAALVGIAAWADLHDGAYHSGVLDAYDGQRIGPAARCLGGFMLGMLGWRLSAWRPAARAMAPAWVGAGLLAWLVGGLALGLPDLAVYPAFPLLVMHLTVSRSEVAGLFASAPLVRLGVWSYSIYLLHAFLLAPLRSLQTTLGAVLPGTAAAVAGNVAMLAVLLACAELTHRFVELPGRRALQSLHPAARERRAAMVR